MQKKESSIIRLDKFLSHAGFAPRSMIKRYLKSHEVLVNGTRVKESGIRIDLSQDMVTIDGEKVDTHSSHYEYYALNKPIGIISTTSDSLGRENVTDLISTDKRIYPIGRLDKDTHGLILLTNDGTLTHQLIHPKYHVPKVYYLHVAQKPTEEQLHAFKTGVALRDGITLPAEIKIVNSKSEAPNPKQIQNSNDQNTKRFENLDLKHSNIVSNFDIRISELEVTLHEGRYRQIRRMCEHLEIELLDLKRVSFGPVQLGDLKAGEYRQLTQKEIDELRNCVERK